MEKSPTENLSELRHLLEQRSTENTALLGRLKDHFLSARHDTSAVVNQTSSKDPCLNSSIIPSGNTPCNHMSMKDSGIGICVGQAQQSNKDPRGKSTLRLGDVAAEEMVDFLISRPEVNTGGKESGRARHYCSCQREVESGHDYAVESQRQTRLTQSGSEAPRAILRPSPNHCDSGEKHSLHTNSPYCVSADGIVSTNEDSNEDTHDPGCLSYINEIAEILCGDAYPPPKQQERERMPDTFYRSHCQKLKCMLAVQSKEYQRRLRAMLSKLREVEALKDKQASLREDELMKHQDTLNRVKQGLNACQVRNGSLEASVETMTQELDTKKQELQNVRNCLFKLANLGESTSKQMKALETNDEAIDFSKMTSYTELPSLFSKLIELLVKRVGQASQRPDNAESFVYETSPQHPGMEKDLDQKCSTTPDRNSKDNKEVCGCAVELVRRLTKEIVTLKNCYIGLAESPSKHEGEEKQYAQEMKTVLSRRCGVLADHKSDGDNCTYDNKKSALNSSLYDLQREMSELVTVCVSDLVKFRDTKTRFLNLASNSLPRDGEITVHVLIKELEKTMETLGEINADRDKIKEELESKDVEVRDLRSLASSNSEEIVLLSKKLEDAKKISVEKEEKLNSLLAKLNEVTFQLSECQEELETKKSKEESLQKALSQLKVLYDKLESEKNNLLMEVQALASRHLERDAVEHAMVQDKTNNAKMITDKEKEIIQLRDALGVLAKKIKSRSSMLKKVSNECEQLKKERDDLLKETDKLRMQMVSGESEKNKIKSNLVKLQEEHDMLATMVSGQVDEKQREIATMLDRLRKTENDFKLAKKALKAKNETENKAASMARSLQKQVTSQRNEIDLLQNRLQWLEEAFETAEKEAEMKENIIVKLKSERMAAQTNANGIAKCEAVEKDLQIEEKTLGVALEKAAVKYSLLKEENERKERDRQRERLGYIRKIQVLESQLTHKRDPPISGDNENVAQDIQASNAKSESNTSIVRKGSKPNKCSSHVEKDTSKRQKKRIPQSDAGRLSSKVQVLPSQGVHTPENGECQCCSNLGLKEELEMTIRRDIYDEDFFIAGRDTAMDAASHQKIVGQALERFHGADRVQEPADEVSEAARGKDLARENLIQMTDEGETFSNDADELDSEADDVKYLTEKLLTLKELGEHIFGRSKDATRDARSQKRRIKTYTSNGSVMVD